jgi:predicted nucleic acid-binding protein
MVVQDFFSKVVFLDTAPLIYFIEGHSEHQNILSKLFDLNDKGGFSFITSSITLLEVLVKPLREGKTDIAEQYRNILTKAPGIEVFDITPTTSEIAARLRAQYNFRTPDAIQLATSIEAGADYFLTNDNRLKAVNEILVVTVSELK